jgi:hypothetical protein
MLEPVQCPCAVRMSVHRGSTPYPVFMSCEVLFCTLFLSRAMGRVETCTVMKHFATTSDNHGLLLYACWLCIVYMWTMYEFEVPARLPLTVTTSLYVRATGCLCAPVRLSLSVSHGLSVSLFLCLCECVYVASVVCKRDLRLCPCSCLFVPVSRITNIWMHACAHGILLTSHFLHLFPSPLLHPAAMSPPASLLSASPYSFCHVCPCIQVSLSPLVGSAPLQTGSLDLPGG